MKTIPVGKQSVIVDDWNYDRLKHLKLYNAGYKTVRVYWRDPITGRRATCALSKIILLTDAPMVDHKDRNFLNFQVCNLRPCTKSQNQCNHGKRRQSAKNPAERYSRFRGVRWDKEHNQWMAAVCHLGTVHNVGKFDDEAEAAKARDRIAIEVQGEFAVLNFP